mgnify:FL=1
MTSVLVVPGYQAKDENQPYTASWTRRTKKGAARSFKGRATDEPNSLSPLILRFIRNRRPYRMNTAL